MSLLLGDREVATQRLPRPPAARGPVSAAVLAHLFPDRRSTAHGSAAHGADEYPSVTDALEASRVDLAPDADDGHLALWMLNRLRVGSFAGIDVGRVGSPKLDALHRHLESRFEAVLRRLVGPVDPARSLHATLDQLLDGPGDACAGAVCRTKLGVRTVFADKAPYLAWEADPHTMALARLESEVQQVVAEIQADEYGVGHRSTHAEIYRAGLDVLGLDVMDAVDAAPPRSLAFANAAWLFANSYRWRGASVGQLCLLELDSVAPCRRAIADWDRVGLPAEARRWYDVHVLADEEHAEVIRNRLVPVLETRTPWLVADAVFGAVATWRVENG